MGYPQEGRLDIFKITLAACAITITVLGILRYRVQAPVEKTWHEQLVELISNADKQANGYTLTAKDEKILNDGFGKFFDFAYLQEEHQGSFIRRLNPRDPADILAYTIFNAQDTDKRSWALLGEFWLMVLRLQDELYANNSKDILET